MNSDRTVKLRATLLRRLDRSRWPWNPILSRILDRLDERIAQAEEPKGFEWMEGRG